MATLAQCQDEYDAKVSVGHSLPDEYWKDNNEDFKKWWQKYESDNDIYYNSDIGYSTIEAAFEAGQVSSAALAAEFEAALENVSEDCCIKRKRIAELEEQLEHSYMRVDVTRKGLDEQLAKRLNLEKENEALKLALLKCGEAYAEKDLRVAELESDCKAMAEAYTHTVTFYTTSTSSLELTKVMCKCPTCLLAAKYREDDEEC